MKKREVSMRNTSLCILEQTAALRFPFGVSRKREVKSLYYLLIIHSTGKKMAAVQLTTIPCEPNTANRRTEIHSSEKFVPVLTT